MLRGGMGGDTWGPSAARVARCRWERSDERGGVTSGWGARVAALPAHPSTIHPPPEYPRRSPHRNTPPHSRPSPLRALPSTPTPLAALGPQVSPPTVSLKRKPARTASVVVVSKVQVRQHRPKRLPRPVKPARRKVFRGGIRVVKRGKRGARGGRRGAPRPRLRLELRNLPKQLPEPPAVATRQTPPHELPRRHHLEHFLQPAFFVSG